jgi:hypothetical protein
MKPDKIQLTSSVIFLASACLFLAGSVIGLVRELMQ